MVTQGGKITKAENLIHKAASVIKSDDSRERKRMRMEQIAEFMRDGQIPVAEEDDVDKDIFEVYEIGHKESLESINLGPNLTKEYQEELGKLPDEFNKLFTSDPGMTDVIQHHTDSQMLRDRI
ncbi:hypothetical protein RRG08_046413 [Elysia crispata]|uniref:Uncharacterized protein n=1 Tax=Elysia crispata TaxID=231223 RepID=A0AAE1AER4_9GAST|nr:hypothetical protein RRG08_046413 [Elysia crispata]